MRTLECVDMCDEACVELCERRFSSVSWAWWKQTSQLGVCPRSLYMIVCGSGLINEWGWCLCSWCPRWQWWQ